MTPACRHAEAVSIPDTLPASLAAILRWLTGLVLGVVVATAWPVARRARVTGVRNDR